MNYIEFNFEEFGRLFRVLIIGVPEMPLLAGSQLDSSLTRRAAPKTLKRREVVPSVAYMAI